MTSLSYHSDYYDSAEGGFTHLLLIAVDEYKDSFPSLENCKKDAISVKNVLVSKYGIFDKNVVELYDKKATKRAVYKKLKEYRLILSEQDNLIILFSGHGRKIEERGFWTPYDATVIDELDDISNDDLKSWLDNIKVRHLLLIMDSCFSGSIFASTRGDTEEEADTENPSRWGISASHSRERAYDGTPGDNSPFAKSFVASLNENSEPKRIQSLFVNVVDKVKQATDGKQEPICRPLNIKGDELGSFVLTPTKNLEIKFKQLLSTNSPELKQQVAQSIYKSLLQKEEIPRNYLFMFATIGNKVRTGLYTEEEIVSFMVNVPPLPAREYSIATTNHLRLLEKNQLLRLQATLKNSIFLEKYLKTETDTIIENYKIFLTNVFKDKGSKVLTYNRITEQWVPFIKDIFYFSNFSIKIEESISLFIETGPEASINNLMTVLIERPVFFHYYIIRLASIKREHEKALAAGYKISNYDNSDHYDRLQSINLKLFELINTIKEEHPDLFHQNDLSAEHTESSQ